MSDITKMKDAGQMLDRLRTIRDLPTMPVVLMRLNRVLQDDAASIEKVGHLIETDQAMSSKILKLVNSAFFGFPSRVSNISHALMILGFNTVRNAAISVSLIDAMRIKPHVDAFDMKEFLRHTIAVAVAGRHLARKLRMREPDDAFTAGLLHDIGKLILIQFLPDLFDVVWKRVREDGITFFEAEQKELPLTHADIGAQLARLWQFPDGLVSAIAFHHNLPCPAEISPTIVAVSLADRSVNEVYRGIVKDAGLSRCFPGYESFVGEMIAAGSEWIVDLEKEIEETCEYFLEGR
jgi:putative nucleotidyltransferase with HDIG domain